MCPLSLLDPPRASGAVCLPGTSRFQSTRDFAVSGTFLSATGEARQISFVFQLCSTGKQCQFPGTTEDPWRAFSSSDSWKLPVSSLWVTHWGPFGPTNLSVTSSAAFGSSQIVTISSSFTGVVSIRRCVQFGSALTVFSFAQIDRSLSIASFARFGLSVLFQSRGSMSSSLTVMSMYL